MSGPPLTRGLFNDKNSCYANSLLQVLARCPAIKTWALTYNHDACDGDPNDCLKCIFRDTLLDMLQPPWEASFIPHQFLDWIRRKDKRFTAGTQSDPHELLDFLIKEMKLDFFTHLELEEIVCNGVDEHVIQEPRVATPPGAGMQIEIGTTNYIPNLNDSELLQQYFVEMCFNTPDNCPTCHGKRCIRRRIVFAPSVLILRIVRFKLVDGVWIKNISPCCVGDQLKLKLIDNEEAQYKFTAAIKEVGDTPVSGHCMAKVRDNNCWYTYSDADITPEELAQGDVYLLFYSRVDSNNVEEIYENQGQCEFPEAEVTLNKDVRLHSLTIGDNDQRTTLFMLLVVNCCERHSPSDLLGLWNEGTAEFGIYVGRTTNKKRFDLHGLLQDGRGKKANGLHFINQSSVVYLVTSKQITDYEEAVLGEEKLLRVFMQRQVDCRELGIKPRFELLNRQLPNLGRFKKHEDQLEIDSFISAGHLPFRFLNEPYMDIYYPNSILNRHLVHEILIAHNVPEVRVPKLVGFRSKKITQKSNSNPNELQIKAKTTGVSTRVKTAKVFQCTLCPKQFKKSEYLRYHQNTHGTGNKFVCKFCSKEFNRPGNLYAHEQMHENRKKYKCAVCSKRYNTSGSLAQHQKYHENKKAYRCSLCDKRYNTAGSLSNHRRTHKTKKEKDFQCQFCHKRFNRLDHLRSHENTHGTEKKFICEACNKGFNNASGLYEHIEVHKNERKYECLICSNRFNTRSGLSRHKKIHENKKAYLCLVCGKRFNNPSGLYNHRTTHIVLKNFSCTICTKRFNCKPLLKSHLISHSKEEKFECEVCTKRFKRVAYLREHAKVHQNQKLFKCDKCWKSYNTKRNLVTHSNSHDISEKFACPFCKKLYIRKHAFDAHVLKHVANKDMNGK